MVNSGVFFSKTGEYTCFMSLKELTDPKTKLLFVVIFSVYRSWTIGMLWTSSGDFVEEWFCVCAHF